MRLRLLSKAEWTACIVIVVILAVLVAPPSHRLETSSQSCHLCGNCRVVIRNVRWWRLQSEVVEPVVGAQFEVPVGHEHDWWQYKATFNSYREKWAADNAAPYRDGRLTWTP